MTLYFIHKEVHQVHHPEGVASWPATLSLMARARHVFERPWTPGGPFRAHFSVFTLATDERTDAVVGRLGFDREDGPVVRANFSTADAVLEGRHGVVLAVCRVVSDGDCGGKTTIRPRFLRPAQPAPLRPFPASPTPSVAPPAIDAPHGQQAPAQAPSVSLPREGGSR